MSAAQNQANTLSQAKRKLEGTIAHMQEEAEDLENEAKNADDRAKKAAIEVRSLSLIPFCIYIKKIVRGTIAQWGTPDFKWRGLIEWGQKSKAKNIPRASNKTEKNPCTKN